MSSGDPYPPQAAQSGRHGAPGPVEYTNFDFRGMQAREVRRADLSAVQQFVFNNCTSALGLDPASVDIQTALRLSASCWSPGGERRRWFAALHAADGQIAAVWLLRRDYPVKGCWQLEALAVDARVRERLPEAALHEAILAWAEERGAQWMLAVLPQSRVVLRDLLAGWGYGPVNLVLQGLVPAGSASPYLPLARGMQRPLQDLERATASRKGRQRVVSVSPAAGESEMPLDPRRRSVEPQTADDGNTSLPDDRLS